MVILPAEEWEILECFAKRLNNRRNVAGILRTSINGILDFFRLLVNLKYCGTCNRFTLCFSSGRKRFLNFLDVRTRGTNLPYKRKEKSLKISKFIGLDQLRALIGELLTFAFGMKPADRAAS